MSQKVTVYGSGLIGCGWAVCFLRGGKEVTIYDIDDNKLNAARKEIERALDFFKRQDVAIIDEAQKIEYLKRLKFTCNVQEAVCEAEFIQESGPENLEIKKSMLAAIEQFNSTAIIASSTASLSITDIAADAKHPGRVVAGHPFLPVHIMPLVEVVGGEKTDPEVVKRVVSIYQSIGKCPITLKKEQKGFVANSIQNAVYQTVVRLVSEGVCTVRDADLAMINGPGLRWSLLGPFLVMELAGGAGGIERRIQKFKGSGTAVDFQTICDGTKGELSARLPQEGNTHEGLEDYRNRKLLELLNMRGKSE